MKSGWCTLRTTNRQTNMQHETAVELLQTFTSVFYVCTWPLWTGVLWKEESHFVSCRHDGRLLNLLINDQGNLEENVAQARARMSVYSLKTSATFTATVRSLCSFVYPISLQIWSLCLDLLLSSNLSLNPQMFPVSDESLCVRKFHPAPTTRSVVACYVREQVQFPSVSISDRSE